MDAVAPQIHTRRLFRAGATDDPTQKPRNPFASSRRSSDRRDRAQSLSASRDIAVSDARDAVTLAVNGCVSHMMEENDYGYDYFVTLEKDAQGNIAAITTNTAHINAMSSQLMQEIARAADSESLNIKIPLGSLLGSNLLMGRGPMIPVQVKMLTSSFVRFDNDLVSTGINQSRHIVTLIADVDVDIMIPLSTVSTTVETEILIAETVIVGRVPDTYLNYHGG